MPDADSASIVIVHVLSGVIYIKNLKAGSSSISQKVGGCSEGFGQKVTGKIAAEPTIVSVLQDPKPSGTSVG